MARPVSRRWGLAALSGLALARPGPGLSQGSPGQTIRLVVPFAPGGAVDILARVVAPKVQETLGVPVVVENRAGAAGLIAAEFVARSAPDGTTLLVASAGQVTIAPALNRDMPFNPARDLVAVTHLIDTPNVILAGPGLPQVSLAAIIAEAKARPGTVSYASPGTGSVTHLMMELLAQTTGTELLHVPYRGMAPATADLIAGRVGMTMTTIASVKPYLDRGELRPLAVAAANRSSLLPAVPTTAEAGVEGLAVPVWIGVMARSGTPAPIIERLHQAFVAALALAEVRERLAPLGAEVVGDGPAPFGAMLAVDAARWQRLVTAGNITLQ